MNTYQELVQEFHYQTGSTVGQYPELRDNLLRAKLILEEAVETAAAMGFEVHAQLQPVPSWGQDGPELIAAFHKTYDKPNFPDAIDGLCDLIYVVLGSAVAWGIDLDPFFAEVHRANMDKLTGPKREDGKQLKPEGWKGPDHERILFQQQNLAEAWKDMEAEFWAQDEAPSPAEVRHERLDNGEAAA